MVPGGRPVVAVRRQGRLSGSRLRLPRCADGSHGSARQVGRPASIGVRSRIRHVDRCARLSQVPQPALRPQALARAERQPGELGRLSRRDVEKRRAERRRTQSTRRRLDRTALPDRHDLRLVPHRVRSAEPAGGSGAACLGEPQGSGRQPVHARLGDPDVGHARQRRSKCRCSRTRVRARPTHRRSRATRSTTPAR